MNSKMMLALTAALGTAATSQDATTAPALIAWVSEYEPLLLTAATELFSGPFSWGEVGKLAEVTVKSVNTLRGIIVGTDRAKVSQAVVVIAAKEAIQFLPLPARAVAGWVLPLLEGPVVAGLIQAAFDKLFPPTVPVVDAPELPSGADQ